MKQNIYNILCSDGVTRQVLLIAEPSVPDNLCAVLPVTSLIMAPRPSTALLRPLPGVLLMAHCYCEETADCSRFTGWQYAVSDSDFQAVLRAREFAQKIFSGANRRYDASGDRLAVVRRSFRIISRDAYAVGYFPAVQNQKIV